MENLNISIQKSNLSKVMIFCSLVFICGVALIFAKSTAILLFVLVLPSFLIAIGDPRTNRSSFLAVFLFGVAASCYPLGLLWRSNQTIEIAMALASDIRTLSIAWASQAGGWLLTQTLPLVVERSLEANAEQQIVQLYQRRAALIDEWHISSEI